MEEVSPINYGTPTELNDTIIHNDVLGVKKKTFAIFSSLITFYFIHA